MPDQTHEKNWKTLMILYGVICGVSIIFYLKFGKAITFGWLLGILFTTILQFYRKFMYQHIFHDFSKKSRVMTDLISHQILVTLIVLMPFIISVKHREKFDLIGVFLAFFCERIYWLVTHYLKEKRRV